MFVDKMVLGMVTSFVYSLYEVLIIVKWKKAVIYIFLVFIFSVFYH